MDSLTKPVASLETINTLVREAFGSRTQVSRCEAAEDGWFNAGFRLVLSGGDLPRTFLKIGPPADCPVLTYEMGLMAAEVSALEALEAVGVEEVPRVIAKDFGRRQISSDCFFMEWIEGVSLDRARADMSQEDRLRVRRQIGRVCGAAHRIEADYFGYWGRPALQASSWRDALTRMVGALFEDAVKYQAGLPEPPEVLFGMFEAALEGVRDPPASGLTHYDLWDKNVIVRQGPEGWRLSGVIDWERGFYGDPLADVFSATVFCDEPEREAVLAGLAESGSAVSVEEAGLALYRAYLWLIAITEAPSRGFGGSIRTPQSAAARRLMRDLRIAAGS